MNETRALRQFRNANCLHIPQLVDTATIKPLADVDQLGMAEGYLTYIFMNSMPGARLVYCDFWSKSVWQREQIRQAFKIALK